MLISGPVDGNQLLDAVRTWYERGPGLLKAGRWLVDAPESAPAAG